MLRISLPIFLAASVLALLVLVLIEVIVVVVLVVEVVEIFEVLFAELELAATVEEEDEGIKHRIRKLTTRSYPQPTLDSIFERDDN